MENISREHTYEIQIGPFKKPHSKFEEGMLPYVCNCEDGANHDLGPFEYPKTKNIAPDIISDVSYQTHKKQDGTSISFLVFKMSVKTYVNEVNKLLISYSEPYTYSRL